MSWLDFFRKPGWRRDRAAIAIDLEAGVLEQCPICRAVTDKGHDGRLPEARRLAAQRMASADPTVSVFDGDLQDLLARLDSVRRRFDYACNCEKGG